MEIPTDHKSKGIKAVLITEDQIVAEVAKMAAELDAEYKDDKPLFICVLRGAVAFMADLTKQMTIPLEMDFMAVSSYGSSTKSSGVVRIIKDLDEEISGRRLIVVEDIVDSGLTLPYLLDHLSRRNPKDIRVVAMVKKEKPDAIAVQVDRIGFTVPDEFVVGYGLDYAGEYRNLPYIGILDPSVYAGVDDVILVDDEWDMSKKKTPRDSIESHGVLADWWRRGDSNPRPLQCDCSALPTELRPPKAK